MLNHEKVTDYLLHLKQQSQRASLISYGLCGAGFLLYIQVMVGGSKYDLVQYCLAPKTTATPEKVCHPEKIYSLPSKEVSPHLYSGVSVEYPVKTQQGYVLPGNALRQGILKSDKPWFLVQTLMGSIFVAGGLMLYQYRTDKNERDFSLIYELEKTDAFNMQMQFEYQRSKYARDIELDDQSHAQFTQETLAELSPELQEKLERAKQIEFELAEAEHQAQLAQIQAEKSLYEAEAAKSQHEAKKLSIPTPKKEKLESKEAIKTELIEKLKDHEDGWLYELCTGYKPLWILGDMGSWKSYCAATIALCRYYLNGWEIESICDPHLHQNRSKSWKELLELGPKCYGSNQDWNQINQGILKAFDRWATREEEKDSVITSIWDEITNYSKHEECAKSASEFAGRVVSDPRKAAEGIILIAHAFTNKTTGGSEGYAEAREGNSIQLRLTSTNKMQPTFKGKLTGFKNEEGEVLEELAITLPKDWLNPEAMRRMFA